MEALALRRIVIFAIDTARLAAFYRDVIGLRVVASEEGWIEFDAGGSRIALHQSRAKAAGRPPKLSFFAADVAGTRAALVRRGATGIGPVKSTGRFEMCDGKDPEGNPFQISSRG